MTLALQKVLVEGTEKRVGEGRGSVSAVPIGESLFTFFASLAYVPLFLLELQSRSF